MSQVSSLNEVTLEKYLKANMPGFEGPLTATKFPGGQSNPTFRIDTASGSYVLRRQPPGTLLKSAHAVDREFRVISALANTCVPVAEAHHLCEDPNVIGSMFYVMEFCDGNIHWASKLDSATNNKQRAKMYDEMNRVLAAIHSVDVEKVGLADYGRPGNYYERQFNRWSSQYQASEMTVIPEMDRLIDWLGDNIPEDDGKVSLVHGDYRLDNLMFSKDDQQIVAYWTGNSLHLATPTLILPTNVWACGYLCVTSKTLCPVLVALMLKRLGSRQKKNMLPATASAWVSIRLIIGAFT